MTRTTSVLLYGILIFLVFASSIYAQEIRYNYDPDWGSKPKPQKIP
jgi:hypothetical protein